MRCADDRGARLGAARGLLDHADGADGVGLDLADQVGDPAGGGVRLLGELAHLLGDDGEAAALLARAGGLDGRVQRQQVRLVGEAVMVSTIPPICSDLPASCSIAAVTSLGRLVRPSSSPSEASPADAAPRSATSRASLRPPRSSGSWWRWPAPPCAPGARRRRRPPPIAIGDLADRTARVLRRRGDVLRRLADRAGHRRDARDEPRQLGPHPVVGLDRRHGRRGDRVDRLGGLADLVMAGRCDRRRHRMTPTVRSPVAMASSPDLQVGDAVLAQHRQPIEHRPQAARDRPADEERERAGQKRGDRARRRRRARWPANASRRTGRRPRPAHGSAAVW